MSLFLDLLKFIFLQKNTKNLWSSPDWWNQVIPIKRGKGC